MLVNDLRRVWGNQKAASKAIGVPESTISTWSKTGIPYNWQCALHYDHRELKAFHPSREHAQPGQEAQL